MREENKLKQVMARLRVKDLDFKSNQITFIDEGKIRFLNLGSDKMDVLKDLCVGKSENDFLFTKDKYRIQKSPKKTFRGSAEYGDDIVTTLRDVILNYL